MPGAAAYAIDARVTHVDANGVPIGATIGILNPVKLVINTPSPEVMQQISHERDSFGQVLNEIVISKPTEIEFSTDDTDDAEVIGWSFSGTPGAYTQAAATVTAEQHVATLGSWLDLDNRAVSALVVKDNATGLITYAIGDDYLLDPVSGKVLPLKGGAIADAEELKFAYTAASLTGDQIDVGTRPAIYVRIDGEGQNLATGDPVNVFVRRARLSNSGSNDLVGGKLFVTDMKGTALKVPGFPVARITRPKAA